MFQKIFHKIKTGVKNAFARFASSTVVQKTRSVYRRIAVWFGNHPATMAIALALGIAFINELLNRRSLVNTLVFCFTKPHFFLCNAAIVMIFESIGLMFKKRSYMMTLFSVLILALGITNFVIRFFRQTPFSAMDFTLVKSVFPILVLYLSALGLVLTVAALIAVLVLLILLWRKAKITPVRRKYAAITLAASSVACALLIGGCYLFQLIPRHFSNLGNAYEDYGFTFCFTVSIVDRGIDKPDDYEEKIKDIIKEILSSDSSSDSETVGSTESAPPVSDSTTEPVTPPDPVEETPNVIFVQLESFYDLKLLEGFSFSEDPMPVFSALKDSYTHGKLTVPSIGTGTANTEFEVLTGMSLKWFGAGEYPYETILQKKTCETVCYNLKNHGYSTHAVHNYKGNFYDRSGVFSNLGFDTFTPIEYMNGIETNLLGWAEDKILTNYVLSAMKSTEGSDLVYCISVQPHGKYPTAEYETEEQHIEILSYPEGANEYSFSYYVDQLHATDEFIGALIASVQALEEETIIVFFGDHIPNIEVQAEWLTGDMTLYDTEYVIWSSEGAIGENRDLTSYQLSAEIMSLLGYNDGILTKLHQTWSDKKDYEIYLEMLEYDILYGECFAYDGKNPFEPTSLKLGIEDIVITGVQVIGGNTYISGKNFTESSRIYLNGIMRTTEFLDPNTLILSGIEADSGDRIKVVQIADLIIPIGETKEYVCP